MVWYRARLWQQLKAGACRRFEVNHENLPLPWRRQKHHNRGRPKRYLLNVRASRWLTRTSSRSDVGMPERCLASRRPWFRPAGENAASERSAARCMPPVASDFSIDTIGQVA